jgi:hypothetical protein
MVLLWKFPGIEKMPRPYAEIVDILIDPVHDRIVTEAFLAYPRIFRVFRVQGNRAAPPYIMKKV